LPSAFRPIRSVGVSFDGGWAAFTQVQDVPTVNGIDGLRLVMERDH